jgi:hypothetical protein
VRTVCKLLTAICSVLLLPIHSLAGPLSQCIGATLSADHHVLVINELTFNDPDETHVRKVTGSTFRVLEPVREPNAGLRMSGPNLYWPSGDLGAGWGVRFSSSDSAWVPACPYVLVTNDAEFLILLESSPSRIAMRIYRRREHPGQPLIDKAPDHGVLIRAVPLNEIQPAASSPLQMTFTDHTPQWYSHGDWTFTTDNKTLVFRGKTFGTVHIDLATGAVSKF